jgi:hypothetical protein
LKNDELEATRDKGAPSLEQEPLDLDTPLGQVPIAQRAQLARKRVMHHLLAAVNALSDAGNESRDVKYTYGMTIALAVAHSVDSSSAPSSELKELALKAAPLLQNVDPDGVPPHTVHGIAEAKAIFLRVVRQQLAGCSTFLRGHGDGRLNWDHLSRVADSADELDALPALVVEATTVARALVVHLFFDQRLLQLHLAPALGSGVPHQVRRLTRVVVDLATSDQATPLQVARATLFLLGRKPAELKNFFSNATIEASEELPPED